MWPAAARPSSIIAFYTGAFAHLSPMCCRASLKGYGSHCAGQRDEHNEPMQADGYATTVSRLQASLQPTPPWAWVARALADVILNPRRVAHGGVLHPAVRY